MSSATDDRSPSERYAEYRTGRKHPVLRDFRALYGFTLDAIANVGFSTKVSILVNRS